MGFFQDLKEDYEAAVDELLGGENGLPEEEETSAAKKSRGRKKAAETEEAMEQEALDLSMMAPEEDMAEEEVINEDLVEDDDMELESEIVSEAVDVLEQTGQDELPDSETELQDISELLSDEEETAVTAENPMEEDSDDGIEEVTDDLKDEPDDTDLEDGSDGVDLEDEPDDTDLEDEIDDVDLEDELDDIDLEDELDDADLDDQEEIMAEEKTDAAERESLPEEPVRPQKAEAPSIFRKFDQEDHKADTAKEEENSKMADRIEEASSKAVIPELEDEEEMEISDETATITKGMKIAGNIKSNGNLDLEGIVVGNIRIAGKANIFGEINGDTEAGNVYADGAQITGAVKTAGSVKVAQSSVIIGDITATSAVIAGAVKGNIDVHGPVILDSTAIVMGDIKSQSVQITSGAVVEGMCSQCYAKVSPASFFEQLGK